MSLVFANNIMFRANIFNYDIKYLEFFIKGSFDEDYLSHQIDFDKEIVNHTDTIKAGFFKLEELKKQNNIEKQLENFNSLVGLLREDDQNDENEELYEEANETRIKPNKDSKLIVQTFIEVLSGSIEKLLSTVNSIKSSENQATLNSLKKKQKILLNNIIVSLFSLDGIVMCNIELSAVLELLGDNVGVDLTKLLFEILEDSNSILTDQIKEVASHILSCVSVFTVKKEFEAKEFNMIIQWVFNYNNCKDKKRDCLLTTNFYIILSNQIGLKVFLEDFPRGLFELTSIFGREHSINVIYESIFCVWNIANSSHIEIFEKNVEGIFDKLISVIKLNKVEKIVRIGILCIKSLLSSEKCVEYLIDYHFGKTTQNLLSNKWSDPVIKEELLHIYEFLEKNHKTVNSFEKYKKEIDSGKLKWGFLHTSEFWEDHFRDFEYKDFEYIRLLTEIIKAPQIRDADLDKKCIACYDLGEFAKFYPGGSAVVNQLGAKEHLLELIQHENLELKNRALVCLQKIMMRTTKK